ncbi:hypothetical protein phytr_1880 [Candidatus Phycorickettsia trachydisci]|uniref:Uncharacterized protein n=1 Tax=Candidatus Phycorickettsia trachydisci TaxID=2115978 RepID=A0A2P1P7B3_9RICK|nr:hypothetical protein [Candidatus Phycorickettsia trachydisci]AVP87146.1 hypothetical protein phytr_1880 [Candidatus Phycorickettsia trachydisci]
MGKNGNNSDNGGQDTHFRSADGQSETKIILDKQTEDKISQLSQKCEKEATDKEVIADIKDLIHSVADKNISKVDDNEKSNMAQMPLQISDEDYRRLSSRIKKSQDVNRGNPDTSRKFTKQILSEFITTKARDRINYVIANKLLHIKSNELRVIEKGSDHDYAARKTLGIIKYLRSGQVGRMFKIIAGKALRTLTLRATGDVKENARRQINERQNSGNKGKGGGHDISRQ